MTRPVDDFPVIDGIHLQRTMTRHLMYVREGLLLLRQDLERRGEVHDASKFSDEEFPGFCRINRAAREHPYGSDEYRAGLRQEKPTIEAHYAANSHHPENHQRVEMGFLDIIEMVCDWRGAYLAYGSQGSWEDNIKRQHERYADTFTPGQWWLIDQLAEFFGGTS